MRIGPGKLKIKMVPDKYLGQNEDMQPFDCLQGVALKFDDNGVSPAEFLVLLKAAYDAMYRHAKMKLLNYMYHNGHTIEEIRKLDPSFGRDQAVNLQEGEEYPEM